MRSFEIILVFLAASSSIQFWSVLFLKVYMLKYSIFLHCCSYLCNTGMIICTQGAISISAMPRYQTWTVSIFLFAHFLVIPLCAGTHAVSRATREYYTTIQKILQGSRMKNYGGWMTGSSILQFHVNLVMKNILLPIFVQQWYGDMHSGSYFHFHDATILDLDRVFCLLAHFLVIPLYAGPSDVSRATRQYHTTIQKTLKESRIKNYCGWVTGSSRVQLHGKLVMENSGKYIEVKTNCPNNNQPFSIICGNRNVPGGSIVTPKGDQIQIWDVQHIVFGAKRGRN